MSHSEYVLQHFSQCFQISNQLFCFGTELMPNWINKQMYHPVKVLRHCILYRYVIRVQLQ